MTDSDNKKNKMKQSPLKWIFYISERFSKVDRKGRSAVTSTLSALGVCFGVMTLIVTISVMNGFQSEFIDSILEISSSHLLVKNVASDEFPQWCSEQKKIVTAVPFYEAQGLVVGPNGKQSAALMRAVPENINDMDEGFKKECRIIGGSFDLEGENKIVLGNSLARQIGAGVGSKVNLMALSGSSDVALVSNERVFEVTGLFYCGYADINQSYAFLNFDDGKKYFGANAEYTYGVKIKDANSDAIMASVIQKQFPDADVESWRSYNRTFFGALRVEKNILMMLVFLIFIIVAVNIYNAMRRMVYERREEIAVLTALGGTKNQIQSVFILQGFLTGVKGAVPGLILGLFLCIKMDGVFKVVSKLEYFVTYFFTMIASPAQAAMVSENPMFNVYGAIPAKMYMPEILLITFFGIFSSMAASWAASSGILKLTVSEVLRDE